MIRLTDISDQVTGAVTAELFRAQARHDNFRMGLPAPGDTEATDHFDRILDQLSDEAVRVRQAKRHAVR